MPERVSMEDFRFEVNKETGRARVVVDYTYPDMPAFGGVRMVKAVCWRSTT